MKLLPSILIAIALTALFSNSVCIAVYCTEDCDPCLVQTCKCSTCSHTHAGFEIVHRLDAYDLSVIVDSEDQVTRIYTNIVGLSLDRAQGVKPHAQDDLVQFARNVLAINDEQFRSVGEAGAWTLDGVQTFGGSRVASFHRASGSSVSMLFDARGNLIEIDHAQR